MLQSNTKPCWRSARSSDSRSRYPASDTRFPIPQTEKPGQPSRFRNEYPVESEKPGKPGRWAASVRSRRSSEGTCESSRLHSSSQRNAPEKPISERLARRAQRLYAT